MYEINILYTTTKLYGTVQTIHSNTQYMKYPVCADNADRLYNAIIVIQDGGENECRWKHGKVNALARSKDQNNYEKLSGSATF